MTFVVALDNRTFYFLRCHTVIISSTLPCLVFLKFAVAWCWLPSKPRCVAPWSCGQCRKIVTEKREAHDFMRYDYKAYVLDWPQCPHQDIVKNNFVGHLEHAHNVTLGLDDQVKDYVQPASKFWRMPPCPHCGICRTTVQSMADHLANAHGDETPVNSSGQV